MEKARHYDIKVIPSPDSMLPILAKAKYYICATSLGGGIKLRVMDGLQAGLPVVCHAVSARGYEAIVKKGLLLVYDDKKSFRTQIEKLKKMHVNKIDIIAAYEEIFSFENGKERLRKILEKEVIKIVFV
jgi:glycosyltransferase involved in cell wall biosynthesis